VRGHFVRVLAAAGVLGVFALEKRSDYESSCRTNATCDQGLYDRGHTMAAGADVLLGVGGASAVGALVLFLTRPAASHVILAPTSGMGAVGGALVGAF
jgi:hypothetical protein